MLLFMSVTLMMMVESKQNEFHSTIPLSFSPPPMTTRPIAPSYVPSASSSSTSHSSRSRPTPTRTLKQPDSFIVATSDDHGPPVRSDKESFRQSLESKAELQRIALNWTERLIEDDPVDRSSFKQACQYIHLETYRSILHERHLSNQCAYPPCPNKSKKPYRSYPAPRSKIVLGGPAGRRIIVQTGNDVEGFCSEMCEKRSEWVIRSGLLRGEGTERGMDKLNDGPVSIELLEEVEERLGREQIQVENREPKKRQESSPSIEISKTCLPEQTTPPPLPSLVRSTSTALPTALVDKIPSLTIYERSTPLTPPLPPTLSPPSSPSHSTSSSNFLSRPTTTATIPSSNNNSKSPASIRAREVLRRKLGGSGSLVPSSLVSSGMRTDLSAEITRGGRSINITPEEADEEVEAGFEGTDENRLEGEKEMDEEEDSWRLMELAREELERMDVR